MIECVFKPDARFVCPADRANAADMGMRRSAAHFAAVLAGVPVLCIVVRPICGKSMPRRGNGLLFGRMTDRTLALLGAVFRAGGFFDDLPFPVCMPFGRNDRIRSADLSGRLRIGKISAACRTDPVFRVAILGAGGVCRSDMRKDVLLVRVVSACGKADGAGCDHDNGHCR